ncbi:hypothetical protein FRB94_013065 [Tulasnella sp. JGI-2019a]|nr:hypothetical protein FRB94_013065 [Tulasnella sp. JGI-2019a]
MPGSITLDDMVWALESLAAVTSMGGAPLIVWMHSAKEALGPNQQVLKMILEPEEYVPPNTNCRVKVLRSNGTLVGYLGPPRFGTSYPEPTPQMVTTTADALVLELPPSQLGADQLTRLTMKSPQWPSYPYLGILPGVESTSVIPGLFYFRACNADAQANTDIKDTTPLGAVFVWSVLKDDLRVYWPASKSSIWSQPMFL